MLKLERLQVFDIEETVSLAEEFNKVYGVSDKFNRKKMRAILEASLIYDKTYYTSVLKEETKVVGLFVGLCTEGLFFDERIASELGWYVQEKHRGLCSIKMLKNFETWAKTEAKADYISMMYTSKMSDLSRLYKGLGYEQAEYTYSKKL
jgi:homoaconitase/3-isopropylmalate dehydratase large subunit